MDPFHPAHLSAERQEAEQQEWYVNARAAAERTNNEAVRIAEEASRQANSASIWLAETIATIKHLAFLSNMEAVKGHAETLTAKSTPKEILTLLKTVLGELAYKGIFTGGNMTELLQKLENLAGGDSGALSKKPFRSTKKRSATGRPIGLIIPADSVLKWGGTGWQHQLHKSILP